MYLLMCCLMVVFRHQCLLMWEVTVWRIL